VNELRGETRFYTTNQSITIGSDEKAREMLQTKIEKEDKRIQLIALEARLRKLQLEDEKIKKRIKDA
jgi:hypothetical protein